MTIFEMILSGLVALLLVLVGLMFMRLGGLFTALQSGEDESHGEHFSRMDTHFTSLKEHGERSGRAVGDEFSRSRKEFNDRLDALGKSQEERIASLMETMRKLGAEQGEQQQQFRDKLDAKMKELREENSKKLDEMRKTVDEQLQTTLEKRLTESFKTVSERLEAVHQGLGEMQKLATGVGDLKRVLTNVKSRGGFGETQLHMLIEDFLTPEQFVVNYDCGKTSGGERVEFGIKMPGKGDTVYLPIDAKFPREDYERLLEAAEVGDAEGIKSSTAALERAVIKAAKDVSSKYINPPFTTDVAFLFLPTEGLYAEILRRPGLFEKIQREQNVTVVGPSGLQVHLSTFRMGYRQMALQERANEVWGVLGAVKKEFNSYGEQIDKMKKNFAAAVGHVEKLETRKNKMLSALKTVEELPDNSDDNNVERPLIGDPE